MTVLEAAIQAAEDRKRAALGERAGLVAADDPVQARAIFSGFDLDHDELTATANRLSAYFNAHYLDGMTGIRALFAAAWTEGVLVGLMVAQQREDDGAV